MKRSMILAALALGCASAAFAQGEPGPGGPRGPGGPGDPWGDATVARADAEAKAVERFAAFDTDKDGVVGEKEEEAAAEMPGGRALGRADYDADGKVTRQEFVDAQLKRFDSQDADKDGQLTKAERDAGRDRMRGQGGRGGPRPEGQ